MPVTEDLKTPAYFYYKYAEWKICKTCLVRVSESSINITAKDTKFYQTELGELLTDGVRRTEPAFVNAFNKTMSAVNPLINNAKAHV